MRHILYRTYKVENEFYAFDKFHYVVIPRRKNRTPIVRIKWGDHLDVHTDNWMRFRHLFRSVYSGEHQIVTKHYMVGKEVKQLMSDTTFYIGSKIGTNKIFKILDGIITLIKLCEIDALGKYSAIFMKISYKRVDQWERRST